MRIGFIGAGKVATAFGRYLFNHGIAVGGYYDHHDSKVAHACRLTQSRPCSDEKEVARTNNVVLITTRDDQIESACRTLCRENAIHAEHLIGHMSGAHPSTILNAAEVTGAGIFSLHPLQAFADEEKAVADLAKTWFSIDGSDERIKQIAQILDQTGNPYFRIQPENKRLYHLAACIFSNYLVTLLEHGMKALTESGIPAQDGLTAMLPLIEGTIANVAKIGPVKALTGPIARGDVSTIQHHLEALDERQLSDLKDFYSILGLKTLELARRDMLKDEAKASQLQRLLAIMVSN